jgi:hypothetical protein
MNMKALDVVCRVDPVNYTVFKVRSK